MSSCCQRNYNVVIKTPLGSIKFIPRIWYSLKVTLTVDRYGSLTLELPSIHCREKPTGYEVSDFPCDTRIEVWCESCCGKFLLGDTAFFVVEASSKRMDDGSRRVVLEAHSALQLLERRINAYAQGETEADIPAMAADDAMKLIVQQNFGTGASSHFDYPDYNITDTTRAAIASYLSIQANSSSIAAQWQGQIPDANVLDTMRRIAEFAAARDEYLFFDVMQTGPYANFEFRTFTGQRGTDRTQATGGVNAVVLTEDRGIGQYEIKVTCKDSANRVYSSTRKSDNTTEYQVEDDPTLATELPTNPFALREFSFSSTSQDPDDAAVEIASELAGKAAAVIVTGQIEDTPSVRYTCEWNWGDKLTVYLENTAYDVFVDSVSIDVSDGVESVRAGFTNEPIRPRLSGIGNLYQKSNEQGREIRRLNTKF